MEQHTVNWFVASRRQFRPWAVAALVALAGVVVLLSARPAPADSHNTRSLNTAYDEPVATYDTAHFRVHYTTSGEHAADPDDAATIGDVFEDAWATQVDTMGWAAPADDGDLGGDGRTDIYLRDGATLPARAHVLVDRFPDGSGSYEPDCDPHRCADVSSFIRVASDFADVEDEHFDAIVASTAHHEFNHVSQNAMAHRVERWMSEGTALWMEGEVSSDRLPPYRPVGHFAQHPDVPLAQNDPDRTPRDYELLYAAWVWPRWVADRHGPEVVRDAWVEALDADQEGLGGYDAALAQHGTSFAEEFLAFAAATAAWRHDFPWYGFSETFRRHHWPQEWDVRREDGVVGADEQRSVTLDHTAYALYELAALEGVRVRVTASENIAGGVVLVADRGLGDVTRVTAALTDGEAELELTSDLAGATLTAGVVNADPTVARTFDPDDPGPVEYAADDITFTLDVEEVPADDESDPGDDEPGPGTEEPPGAEWDECYTDAHDDVSDGEAQPANDADAGHADIVGFCVDVGTDSARFGLRVADPVDPGDDANWAGPHSQLLWDVTSAGTQLADGYVDWGPEAQYAVRYFRVEANALRTTLEEPEGRGYVCDGVATYEDGWLISAFRLDDDSACFAGETRLAVKPTVVYDLDPEGEADSPRLRVDTAPGDPGGEHAGYRGFVHRPEATTACEDRDVPSAGFADIVGNTHEAAIDCVVWHDVAQGTSTTTYAPAATVTRAQMATFIARLVTTAGADLPAGQGQFTDVADTPHRTSVERLAAAGIVQGVGGGRYDPAATVTRAQMGTFLARAFEFVDGDALPVGSTGFTDIAGNPHADNIERIATAGFAQGRTATTYAPDNEVRRDQMSSFLARMLERFAADERLTAP